MQATLRHQTSTFVGPYPKPCATPGCRHRVNESWEESGLLCADCAIEGELYDRDARWDHVSQIPETFLPAFMCPRGATA